MIVVGLVLRRLGGGDSTANTTTTKLWLLLRLLRRRRGRGLVVLLGRGRTGQAGGGLFLLLGRVEGLLWRLIRQTQRRRGRRSTAAHRCIPCRTDGRSWLTVDLGLILLLRRHIGRGLVSPRLLLLLRFLEDTERVWQGRWQGQILF